jgi:SAM-dependent methyltransferase
MQVLDLMSSWVSHLPQSCGDLAVTGLGMNARELDQNPRLRERVVQDINADPTLPFATASFDAVLCSMSVEYLTRPFEVFAEVARVLKPGAPFVLTFSERWFPSKVIQLWTDIHPFERMAVVLDYFRASGLYDGLGTESRRGLPRPEDDKYAATLAEADPVYAVWGRRVAS